MIPNWVSNRQTTLYMRPGKKRLQGELSSAPLQGLAGCRRNDTWPDARVDNPQSTPDVVGIIYIMF